MTTSDTLQEYLQDDSIYCGDARAMLKLVRPESVSLIPIRRDCAANLMAHHPSSVIPAKAGIQ